MLVVVCLRMLGYVEIVAWYGMGRTETGGKGSHIVNLQPYSDTYHIYHSLLSTFKL